MSLIDWFLKVMRMGRGMVSLALCVITALFLNSLERPERQTFHEVMISTFLYPAEAILSRVQTTVLIYQENQNLKQENARLRVENDLLNQQVRQAPRVRELLAFAQRAAGGGADSGGTADSAAPDLGPLRLKLGQITAEDPGRFSSTWVVNLGSEDSVDMNMPVLTSRGIVGKIAKVYRSHSLVQMIIDPNFKVSVTVNRSRARGLLELYRAGSLIARFAPDADIQAGDTLITSGMGGVFPKGLQVGTVLEPNLEADNLLKGASVRPFQNPHLVEEVFVLIREASWTVGGSGAGAEP